MAFGAPQTGRKETGSRFLTPNNADQRSGVVARSAVSYLMGDVCGRPRARRHDQLPNLVIRTRAYPRGAPRTNNLSKKSRTYRSQK